MLKITIKTMFVVNAAFAIIFLLTGQWIMAASATVNTVACVQMCRI